MGYIEGMDNLEEYAVPIRIRIFAGQVNAAANLGTWCFVSSESLMYSTCIMEKEFLGFLKLGKCLEIMEEHKEDMHRPFIISDPLGLVWMSEYVYLENKPAMLIILGPMFLSQTSVKHIEKALRERVSSIHMQRQMMRTLANVPVIPLTSLNQYGKMLHFTLTSEKIQTSDFLYYGEQNSGNNILEQEDKVQTGQPEMNPERILRGEKMILQAIRDGNPAYEEILERESNYNSGFISMTGDALRDWKNTQLVFNALCSRAAMDGGISVHAAKEIELCISGEIEKCKTITELKNIAGNMLDEYVKRVREGQETPLISKAIQECCDYIRANVLSSLTVESIAKELGYTTYYFTKKFSKEMGIKVTDYIKQTRIEYAKIVLITTTKSIQDISDSLHFGTRNYFSKVFREITGMSPAEFRENAGRKG